MPNMTRDTQFFVLFCPKLHGTNLGFTNTFGYGEIEQKINTKIDNRYKFSSLLFLVVNRLDFFYQARIKKMNNYQPKQTYAH